MTGVHGREAKTLWEDIKQFADIEQLEIVGDKMWQHGMATSCKPFDRAVNQCFDNAELEKAHDWLEKGLMASAGKCAKPI